ncbi:hypothetical protein QQF64_018657 [Cirrhinus molitorella]|uniref:Uncharacterized protein n=1 Tax=Cirrhinus molitorella TaxID=172907 RepID=A0ABR3LFN7_9TELE
MLLYPNKTRKHSQRWHELTLKDGHCECCQCPTNPLYDGRNYDGHVGYSPCLINYWRKGGQLYCESSHKAALSLRPQTLSKGETVYEALCDSTEIPMEGGKQWDPTEKETHAPSFNNSRRRKKAHYMLENQPSAIILVTKPVGGHCRFQTCFTVFFFYSSMAVIIGLCGHLYECSISRGLENGMAFAGCVQTCELNSPDSPSHGVPDLHTWGCCVSANLEHQL